VGLGGASSLDVSGLWDGIFNYPRLMPPNAFQAELRDTGGAISGETSERSDWNRKPNAILIALIEGRRIGQAISFTKFYDDVIRLKPVHYEGTLSGDGNEITGTWSIPDSWSGTFIMVRRAAAGLAEERRIAEVVR
jgi:hypothetical protein